MAHSRLMPWPLAWVCFLMSGAACTGKVSVSRDQPTDIAATACTNGVLDPGESAIDCGGICRPCQSGGTCNEPADCESGICTAHTCQQWSSCGNDVVEHPEICDGKALSVTTCQSLGYSGGTLACLADCSGFDTAQCTSAGYCGNGIQEGSEICDGVSLGPTTCTSLGYDGGILACSHTCDGYITTGCTTSAVCGDGVIGDAELCDTFAVGPQRCEELGFAGGILQCNANCDAYDVVACLGGCGNDRIEGAELCDGTALGGRDCLSEGFLGGTLACNAVCDAFDVAACTGGCGNGIREASELCDGTDTGTASCISLGFSAGTLGCTSTCQALDDQACTGGCGNNIRETPEVCDGTDLGTATCQLFGYAGGTLGACNATCTAIDTSQCTWCGNSVQDPGESCDGQDLGAATCVSLGHDGGVLACNGTCDGYDASRCTDCAVCLGGQACTDGACACPAFTVPCSGTCVSTIIDPNNCGGCRVVCGGSTVCYGGACVPASQCIAPLVACIDEHLCVDPKTDNEHCGGCVGSGGTDCTLAGQVCLAGLCSSAIKPVGATPAKCAGGGPAITLGTGGPLDCAGNLAAVSFRWALCSCQDVRMTQSMLTDGFDSSIGPYRAPYCQTAPTTVCRKDGDCGSTGPCVAGVGAGIGANGIFYQNQNLIGTSVFGPLWTSNHSGTDDVGVAWGGDTTVTKFLFVDQDLHVGTNFTTTTATCTADAYLGGDAVGNASIAGTLYASYDSVLASGVTYSDLERTVAPSPLRTAAPCDCNEEQLLDITGIIAAHACDGPSFTDCPATRNDNALIQLNPNVFETGTGRLDLPCGHYYLSRMSADGTIVVHGKAALYVGGNIDGKWATITVDEGGELDIFVGGFVDLNQGLNLGAINFPARTRLYVAGDIGLVQNTYLAANVYAPYGAYSQPQDLLLYGGLFVRDYDITQTTTIHFDTGVVNAGATCPPPCGNGVLDAGEDCDTTAFRGATCMTLGHEGGTLLCTSTCTLDSSACYDCGDGTLNGFEACEGENLNGLSCAALGYMGGTLTCWPNCTLNTTSCYVCGNSRIEGPEACDGADFGGQSCATLGFDSGTLSCNSDCTLDVGDCSLCGNGLLESGERCDGTALAGQRCDSLGFDGGILSCRPNCSYDTTLCTFCGNLLREGDEACDGPYALGGATCVSLGYDAGTLGCTATCTLDDSACSRCGDNVRESNEVCDGADVGGATCESLGYLPNSGTVSCSATCDLMVDCERLLSCGDGVVQQPEQCDGADLGLLDCRTLGFDGGTLAGCQADCTLDTSDCTQCGDLVRDPGEDCDGGDLHDQSCETLGFDAGSLVCRADCLFDTSACAACGNAIIEAGESCDLANLNGETCVTRGFDGGDLSCEACVFNTSDCYRCGDGQVDPGEFCDGTNLNGVDCVTLGFAGGTLACRGDCTFDATNCAGCGDGIVQIGEDCDSTNLAGESCTSLGYAGGALVCTESCAFDVTKCVAYICGNSIREGLEICDGADLNSQSCETQGFSAGGTLACASNCSGYDTSQCVACASCRDCNNQACREGVCTSCLVDSDCCAPLVCFFGECVLF